MVIGPGECIDPERAATVRSDMLAFLQEQDTADADFDVLADIGYPAIAALVEFEVQAAGEPADAEPERLPVEDEPELTGAPAEKPTEKPGPAARRRKRPKARTWRERAAADSRPDLMPFPYGTRED